MQAFILSMTIFTSIRMGLSFLNKPNKELAMLTKLIVKGYSGFIELCMWLFLIAGTLALGVFFRPFWAKNFSDLNNELAWVLAFVCGFPVSMVLCSVLFGPLLVLVDLRNAVWSIEEQNKSKVETEPAAQNKIEEQKITTTVTQPPVTKKHPRVLTD